MSVQLARPSGSNCQEFTHALQALVDMATPAAVFEAVDAAVTAHMKSDKGATEFTGEHICVANFATDPQKVTLCVWWEFSHPGEFWTAPRMLFIMRGHQESHGCQCWCCLLQPKPWDAETAHLMACSRVIQQFMHTMTTFASMLELCMHYVAASAAHTCIRGVCAQGRTCGA